MKNYIKMFMKDNNLEFDEEFRVDTIGMKITKDYKFLSYNEYYLNWEQSEKYIYLLTGEHEINKLPWKPKDGEMYYLIYNISDVNSCIGMCVFDDAISTDLIQYNIGNCFKTKEEAIKNKHIIIDKILEMQKRYDENIYQVK